MRAILFLNTKLMNIINDLDEEYSFKNFIKKETCVFKKHNHYAKIIRNKYYTWIVAILILYFLSVKNIILNYVKTIQIFIMKKLDGKEFLFGNEKQNINKKMGMEFFYQRVFINWF